jgi:glucosyl-3-phosphoglycerate phosphatase
VRYTRRVFDRSKHITLVRHGESLANRGLRWQGQGDSALSELGEAQARAVAMRLTARQYDRVVASDLERASATARAIGRPHERDRQWREFDIGDWEGLTRDQVATRYPNELARLEAGEDVAIGGGESYGTFCQRVDQALARLLDALEPGQHALVVCHGGVIGALVSGALGLRGVRNLPIARVFNTSVTELSYDPDGRATLHVFNDSLHLSSLSLFPHPTEMNQAVALVCEGVPDPRFGSFGAHYDFEQALASSSSSSLGDASSRFLGVVERLCALHPEQRVALSASAGRIHGWAGEAVWSELSPTGRLREPSPGALCHVVARDGLIALVDYGVSI